MGDSQADEKRWRYSKIVADEAALDRLLVDLFLELHDPPDGPVWLDFDATDDPLHGDQEGRFFHGYYKSYCYLPLYIFSGGDLLCARLRPSDIDASAGSVQELERIVRRVRWLKVAAGVTITARKVWVSFASAYPYREEFAAIAQSLRQEPARAPPA